METGVQVIYAFVKPENAASVSAFRQCGYREEKRVSKSEENALFFVLRKDTLLL